MGYRIINKTRSNPNCGVNGDETFTWPIFYVFETDEDLELGNFVGTLKALSPIDEGQKLCDFRFFDHANNQQLFKAPAEFNTRMSADKAKTALLDALNEGRLEKSYGLSVARVYLKDTPDQVPFYLRLEREFGYYSVNDTPELISEKYLQDLDAIKEEINKRDNWLQVSDIELHPVGPRGA